MNVPAEFAGEFSKFPEELRKLVEAELAAGNSIAEICTGFPAPPVGLCLKLARRVADSRRQSGGGVSFYERNNSDYLGEFNDAKRHFFVLEPPLPPPPEPDMDAIRAERKARQRAADAELLATQGAEASRLRNARRKPGTAAEQPPPAAPAGAVAKFIESMEMNYERWHDGTGYDLDILKTASPAERAQIESLLISRCARDWRDVEALAALGTPRARAALRAALKSPDLRVRTAVGDYAPEVVSDRQRTAALVASLEGADTYGGLTQALLQVEQFHPPAVVDALLRGVLVRDEGTPVHFAAMLMFLHGKAESAFDWAHRPFFLKFRTDDRAERKKLFRELCAKIGVKPGKYLRRRTR